MIKEAFACGNYSSSNLNNFLYYFRAPLGMEGLAVLILFQKFFFFLIIASLVYLIIEKIQKKPVKKLLLIIFLVSLLFFVSISLLVSAHEPWVAECK